MGSSQEEEEVLVAAVLSLMPSVVLERPVPLPIRQLPAQPVVGDLLEPWQEDPTAGTEPVGVHPLGPWQEQQADQAY